MRRRRPVEEAFDAVDVLFARTHLKHWRLDDPPCATERHAEALDVVIALRALDRPLDASEQQCLRLADAAGV